MPELTSQILPILRQQRLPDLNLGDEFVYPNYGGLSILNLPDSICRWLGVPSLAGGALAPALLDPLESSLGGNFKRVILVVCDALAFHRLQRWVQGGQIALWQDLTQDGLLAPITSITPSTTSAALTTLWTGRSPTEHGITGYEMWLREYGVVANTILQAPMSMRGGVSGVGSLVQAGFTPEGFLPLTTLGEHLAAQGVSGHVFQHYSILNSGLSQMYFRGVERHPFSTSADLWINLRQMVEQSQPERQYVYVYWSEIDTLSHLYQPDDERVEASFATFSDNLQRLFLERAAPDALQDTLLLLTADHGQIYAPPDPYYDLRNHPSLTRRLHLMPTGEHRLAYLYVRPGQMEAVREYIERTWRNQFTIVEGAYAIEAGLFGPGAVHPELINRVGDLVVIARGNAHLWWDSKGDHMLGRHGGLHPEEMLVPLLAARL